MRILKPQGTVAPRSVSPAASAVTTAQAAVEVQRAVSDGFVTRAEVAHLDALSAAGASPLAKQLINEFATLARANFSTADSTVRGFSDRLARLFHQPDPVTQVPASDLAEATVKKLWEKPGTGSAGDARALVARAQSGQVSMMEAIVEGTALDTAGRAELLATLAAAATTEPEVNMLLAAANPGEVQGLMGRDSTRPFTTEQDAAFVAALGRNPDVPLAKVLEAAEPLNGHNLGWDSTRMRARAEALHATLQGHPDAATANALLPQLQLVFPMGADLSKLVVPLAEDLLAHGASLPGVIAAFPGSVSELNVTYDSPKELGALIERHAARAKGPDADALAKAIHFLGDFSREQSIIGAMTGGAASSAQVLEAIRQSGTTSNDHSGQELRWALRGAEPHRVQMALELLKARTLGAADAGAAVELIRKQGGDPSAAEAIKLLIPRGDLGKEQLMRLIDGVHDAAIAAGLQRQLAAR